jgi:hypothetical protein
LLLVLRNGDGQTLDALLLIMCMIQ